MVRMPWRFKNMCSQSLILKEILNKTIREMEEISSLFVNDSSTNFSRNRVFTFSETITPRHLKHKIYIPIIHSNFYT